MLIYQTPSNSFSNCLLSSISLQNSKNDTALVAALNGTIHLVESNSMKVLWSFTSGPSIYSSYQAPLDQDNATDWGSGFFVDCGEDWELYMHGRHFGKVVWLRLSPLLLMSLLFRMKAYYYWVRPKHLNSCAA